MTKDQRHVAGLVSGLRRRAEPPVYTWSVIRLARPDDLPRLQELERAAGARFAELGMSMVARHAPASLAVLDDYQRDGRAWVSTGVADHPVAYLLIDIVDGAAHVQQVSVHPGHAGRRLGSALLDTAATWAAQRQLRTVTLTTFADVPWNAPYYTRLGFQVIADEQLAGRPTAHPPGGGSARARPVAPGGHGAPR